MHKKILIGVVFLSSLILTCSSTEKKTVEKADVILASLDQSENYIDLHANFSAAFAFLRQENLADLEPGRYNILGDTVFCLISKGPGKKREDAKLEAHKKYIDIQYVISGDEQMGWKPTADCTIIREPYSDEKDIMFFDDAAEVWTTVPPGSFVIFYPKDAHAPMVGDGEIHKAVCKVLL